MEKELKSTVLLVREINVDPLIFEISLKLSNGILMEYSSVFLLFEIALLSDTKVSTCKVLPELMLTVSLL